MSIFIDRLQFLGLNEREVRVFTALATFGRMNMTKIASRSNLPRTTVDAIMRRLVTQGLASKEKVRGHYEYFVDTNNLADTLDWIEKRFRADSDTHKEEKQVLEPVHIPVEEQEFQTRDTFDCRKVYDKYRGDRVKLLFSIGHDDVGAMMIRFANYISESIAYGFKLEVLTSSDVADALLDTDKVPVPKNAGDIRLNVVPATYSMGAHDMFIFRDSVLLFNAYTNMVDHIEKGTIVESSRHLLEIACETGWSIDLTAWLNKN
jgi:sugar-specific transcriptional regulator TrmB